MVSVDGKEGNEDSGRCPAAGGKGGVGRGVEGAWDVTLFILCFSVVLIDLCQSDGHGGKPRREMNRGTAGRAPR